MRQLKYDYPLKYSFTAIILLLSATILAQHIWIDENFDDWDALPVYHTDPQGDGIQSGIDFTDLRVSNDENYLFIDIKVGREINLQSDRNLYLYIDIDDNYLTGAESYGIGADLIFNFGQRRGQFYSSSGISNIIHSHIGLSTAPSVTSDRFEIALKRDFTVGGRQQRLGDEIRIVLSEEIAGGDILPDASGGIVYKFDNTIASVPPDFNLAREENTDFRYMAYNVKRDDLFVPFLQNSYRRIFQAIQPDIIGFCEIYSHSGAETAALIESYLPSAQGQIWHFDEISPDVRIVSRYSIRGKEKLDGNGAFHLDVNGKDLIVIITHLPCCENDNGRQQEIDRIMAFVRDVQRGHSSFQVEEGTPVIIAGDKNFVGKRAQVNTLLYGEIVNQAQFGPSFTPDWDGMPLQDAKPYATGIPFTYTWYSSSSDFSPGRLDYLAYTSSVITLRNTFALYTPGMPEAILQDYNMLSIDTDRASDHLPLVGDFSFSASNSVAENSLKNPGLEFNLFPNPAKDQVTIRFATNLQPDNQLVIYNILGIPVFYTQLAANTEEAIISVSALTPGTYFVKVFDRNKYAVSTLIIN